MRLTSKLSQLTLLALFSAAISGAAFAGAKPDSSSAVEPTNISVSSEQKINLNSASAQELEKGLLGIGAKKAEAIVEYRTKNGNFISIEQLSDVSGIGKATLEKNRHLLTL
ncbi:ComEA family DNA-binding protein [Testudinibacter sp. P27/CKL/0425]